MTLHEDGITRNDLLQMVVGGAKGVRDGRGNKTVKIQRDGRGNKNVKNSA